MPTVFGFGLNIEVNTASVTSSDPSAYMWHMVRCACLAGSGLNTVLEDASLPSLFLNKQSHKTPKSFRESHGVQAGILFPTMDLFLAAWQGHGHIQVLVYIPKAASLAARLDIAFQKFLQKSGWWTEMVTFPHLAPPCPPLCGALPVSHCTSPAPTSFPGSFLSSCMPAKVDLHPYPLYAQPCFFAC